MTTLHVDNREPEHLQNSWETDTQVERLETTDYYVNGVGIERKEINDLVGSINGRLWEQLKRMEDNIADEDNDLKTAILVVHGTVSDLSAQNMDPRKIEGIYGALARICVSYDVEVFWVREESQFKKIVRKIADKSEGGRSEKPHLSKRNYRDDRVNVLYGIYGVGLETAKSLLEEFDSIAGICQASKEDLQRADGVGAKGAKKIYDILHDGEEDKGTLLE